MTFPRAPGPRRTALGAYQEGSTATTPEPVDSRRIAERPGFGHIDALPGGPRGAGSDPPVERITSVNAARSTGPAWYAGGEHPGQLWLFWVAPIRGEMATGALTRWRYEREAIVDTIVAEKRRVA
jgi:hypothetical protein